LASPLFFGGEGFDGFERHSGGGDVLTWPGASEWEATVAALEARADAALRTAPQPQPRRPWVTP
jgi:hypothetical protein